MLVRERERLCEAVRQEGERELGRSRTPLESRQRVLAQIQAQP
jgi:hypothetical protein